VLAVRVAEEASRRERCCRHRSMENDEMYTEHYCSFDREGSKSKAEPQCCSDRKVPPTDSLFSEDLPPSGLGCWFLLERLNVPFGRNICTPTGYLLHSHPPDGSNNMQRPLFGPKPTKWCKNSSLESKALDIFSHRKPPLLFEVFFWPYPFTASAWYIDIKPTSHAVGNAF
jgi:hypothetical protein